MFNYALGYSRSSPLLQGELWLGHGCAAEQTTHLSFENVSLCPIQSSEKSGGSHMCKSWYFESFRSFCSSCASQFMPMNDARSSSFGNLRDTGSHWHSAPTVVCTRFASSLHHHFDTRTSRDNGHISGIESPPRMTISKLKASLTLSDSSRVLLTTYRYPQ